MIAIYNNDCSAPYTMIVLNVNGPTKKDFIIAMIGDDKERRVHDDDHEYPWPTSEVVIIENEKVIEQFFIEYNDDEFLLYLEECGL